MEVREEGMQVQEERVFQYKGCERKRIMDLGEAHLMNQPIKNGPLDIIDLEASKDGLP